MQHWARIVIKSCCAFADCDATCVPQRRRSRIIIAVIRDNEAVDAWLEAIVLHHPIESVNQPISMRLATSVM